MNLNQNEIPEDPLQAMKSVKVKLQVKWLDKFRAYFRQLLHAVPACHFLLFEIFLAFAHFEDFNLYAA